VLVDDGSTGGIRLGGIDPNSRFGGTVARREFINHLGPGKNADDEAFPVGGEENVGGLVLAI
jgi:hypothetical protein